MPQATEARQGSSHADGGMSKQGGTALKLKELFRTALEQSCEDLAREMGMSYDDTVRLKARAEKDAREKARVKRKGPPKNIDRGTKQTRKKSRSCSIYRLLKARRIDAREYGAAGGIAHGYSLATGEVTFRQFRYEEPTSRGWDEYIKLSDVEAEWRYRLWVEEIRRRGISFDLCREVIIEGVPFRVLEDMWGMTHGKASNIIIQALRAYTSIRIDRDELQDTMRQP